MAILTGDEVVEIAIRLEEDGEAFYHAAAEKASTRGVKALFEELATQEQFHRRAFQQMGRGTVEVALSPEEWDEFRAYTDALLQQSLFARPGAALSQATEAHDEQMVLKDALNFEKETLLFFHELREAVGGAGVQTVSRIIQEERQHIQRLSAMLATFSE
jgi:rubrerythrin